MTDKYFWSALGVVIIIYGVMLGYLTGEAHKQCGGWDSCIELANKSK